MIALVSSPLMLIPDHDECRPQGKGCRRPPDDAGDREGRGGHEEVEHEDRPGGVDGDPGKRAVEAGSKRFHATSFRVSSRADVTRLNRGYAVRSIDGTGSDPTYRGAIFSNRLGPIAAFRRTRFAPAIERTLSWW